MNSSGNQQVHLIKCFGEGKMPLPKKKPWSVSLCYYSVLMLLLFLVVLAGQQAHSVWACHQGHGGVSEDQ